MARSFIERRKTTATVFPVPPVATGTVRSMVGGGPSRNFQVFSALDFLAELTQHIPEKNEHVIRYYGWYSHRRRGMRAKLERATTATLKRTKNAQQMKLAKPVGGRYVRIRVLSEVSDGPWASAAEIGFAEK